VSVPGQEEKDEGEGDQEKAGSVKRSLLRPFGWLTAVFVMVLLMIIGFFLGQNSGNGDESIPVSTEDRWQSLSDLPTAISGMASVASDNGFFSIGGETDQGITDLTYRYELSTNQWVELARKPTAVKDMKAAILGGLVYVPGGIDENNHVTDILEIFNPRENQWVNGPEMPLPLSAYAMVVFEGNLYLFGGWDGESYQNIVLIYDPETQSWFEGSPMPTARAYAGAVVASNTIFVIGGWDGKSELAANEAYLPSRDNAGENPWSIKTDLPEGQYVFGVESIGEVIFLLGPSDDESLIIFQYLPQGDEWLRGEESPPEMIHENFATTSMQGYLYILGGRSKAGVVDRVLRYQALFMIMLPSVGK
jgi:hypothetical protein